MVVGGSFVSRVVGRACGSAGERLVHTEEVTGSIPVTPTFVSHWCHTV
jgi:hypothetical protein